MPKPSETDFQTNKRRVGAPEKEVTASVTLRFRATPGQEKRFKEASKKKNTNFSQWVIAILEKHS